MDLLIIRTRWALRMRSDESYRKRHAMRCKIGVKVRPSSAHSCLDPRSFGRWCDAQGRLHLLAQQGQRDSIPSAWALKEHHPRGPALPWRDAGARSRPSKPAWRDWRPLFVGSSLKACPSTWMSVASSVPYGIFEFSLITSPPSLIFGEEGCRG